MDFNDNTPAVFGGSPTMSSLEIAEVTGKRHDHVLRDIRKMLAELNGPSFGAVDFMGSYRDAKGEARECFNLPKRESLILVSGYNVELRAKIIDRWAELEQCVATFDQQKFLADPAALRGLLLQNVEKVIELQGQVREMETTVKAYDQIATADGSLCVTDASKHLGVSPKELFRYLREHQWIYRRAGTAHDVAYQAKILTGLMEHKITTIPTDDGREKIRTQARITPKGLARLSSVFVGEGV